MNLLIRADADAQMGAGHVMRCLALAQAVQTEKGRVAFLSRCESEALRQRVEMASIRFHSLDNRHPHPADLSTTMALLQELHAAWLVLDGYHFDPAYQQAVRAAAYRLLVIDDIAHLSEYHADLVLNQNLNAEHFRYAGDPDTTLLLGPRYALLRQEFLRWRGWRRDIPGLAHKVLVTMGGGDPDNVTLGIIRVLQQVQRNGTEAKVIVGPANPHLEELLHAVRANEARFHLLTNVTDMPALMAWADIALTAGGSTCWEIAFMGLPSVVMVLAENQAASTQRMHEEGAALSLGRAPDCRPGDLAHALDGLIRDPQRRRLMSERGRALVDGRGAERVAAVIRGD